MRYTPDVSTFDPETDIPLVQTIQLDNNTINIKCSPKHGLYQIHFARGQLPEKLQGSYTSASKANKAVEIYLREKGRTQVV